MKLWKPVFYHLMSDDNLCEVEDFVTKYLLMLLLSYASKTKVVFISATECQELTILNHILMLTVLLLWYPCIKSSNTRQGVLSQCIDDKVLWVLTKNSLTVYKVSENAVTRWTYFTLYKFICFYHFCVFLLFKILRIKWIQPFYISTFDGCSVGKKTSFKTFSDWRM